MKKVVWLVVGLVMAVLSAGFAHPANAEESEGFVTVDLSFVGPIQELPIEIKGKYLVRTEEQLILTEGRKYKLIAQNTEDVCLYEGEKELTCQGLIELSPMKSEGESYLYLKKTPYNGRFMIENENSQLDVHNQTYMEDYIKGLMINQITPSWHPEALKSLAVTLRTYALYEKKKPINDDPLGKKYGGYAWFQSSTYANMTNAVKATMGEFITYNGSAIDPVYTISNGGYTELNSNVNTAEERYPYIKTQHDSYDGLAKDTEVNWQITLQKKQIDTSALDMKNPDLWWDSVTESDPEFATRVKHNLIAQASDNPDDLKIVSIEQFKTHTLTSGLRFTMGDLHVKFINRNARDAQGNVPIHNFWSGLRPWEVKYLLSMKSFYVKEQTNSVSAFTLRGSGIGDGVGLSLYGAKNRAEAGNAYTEILSFYYPETKLAKAYTTLANRNIITGNPKGWAIENGERVYYVSGVIANGWIRENGNDYYYKQGKLVTGWITDEGLKYYANQDGIIQFSWLKLDGNWYYFDPVSGAMQTDWLKWNDKWYYLDSEGVMQTGWLTISSRKYFFGEDGALVLITGFQNENGKIVYYDPATGQKFQSGWKQIDRYWYYFKDGAATTGWLLWNGKWYFFNSVGEMKTYWIKDGGKIYYLNKDGVMQTGWYMLAFEWYYLGKSGAMHKGWLTDAGKKYYLKSDGIMAKGWLKIGTSWYYFHSSGVMATGWLKDGTKWYYLDGAGIMQTGWVKSGTKWYYLASSGIMQTGWVKVGTKWYYLYSSGVMAANTTIDGYRLGSDGAWIQ
jgi:SpoIID/LytB domain protein